MNGVWIGLAIGFAYVVASAILFHHYVVRVHKACDWLTRGAILLDVDSEEEFARHHPRVALNMPLEQIAQRARELGGATQPIVVFAHSFRRGLEAVTQLHRFGFLDVMNAAGLRTKERLNAVASQAFDPPDLADLSRIDAIDFEVVIRDEARKPTRRAG